MLTLILVISMWQTMASSACWILACALILTKQPAEPWQRQSCISLRETLIPSLQKMPRNWDSCRTIWIPRSCNHSSKLFWPRACWNRDLICTIANASWWIFPMNWTTSFSSTPFQCHLSLHWLQEVWVCWKVLRYRGTPNLISFKRVSPMPVVVLWHYWDRNTDFGRQSAVTKVWRQNEKER